MTSPILRSDLAANLIAEEAKRELDAEMFRAKVEAEKDRLRALRGRPWWVRLLPYRITITITKR